MKNTKTKLVTFLSVATLFAVGCSAQPVKDAKEDKPMNAQEQTVWIEKLSYDITNGAVSEAEVKEKVDKQIEKFEKDTKEDLIDTYLYSVQANAERLNTVSYNVKDDMERAMKENKDIDFVKMENVNKLPEGVLKGLVYEMKENNLKFIKQKDKSFVVGVDYEKIREEYSKHLTTYLKNSIKLSESEQNKPVYDYELSIIDFDTIYDRLEMIEGFEKDKKEDINEYFESLNYYYYMLLLGFGDSTMNLASGEANENATNAMKAVAEKHADTERGKDMKRVVESIEKEGSYAEKTTELANDILNERFSDYLKKAEETMNEGK